MRGGSGQISTTTFLKKNKIEMENLTFWKNTMEAPLKTVSSRNLKIYYFEVFFK